MMAIFDLGHRQAPCPRSRASDVTPRSAMPHGTMRSKWSRSVVTLNANPWLVIQRAMRTPIAASFSSPTQTPVSPRSGRLRCRSRRHRSALLPDRACTRWTSQRSGFRSMIGITDDLPRAMVRDVAAAAGLMQPRCPLRRERLGRRRMCDRPPSPRTPSVRTCGCSSEQQVSSIAPAGALRRSVADQRRRCNGRAPAAIR